VHCSYCLFQQLSYPTLINNDLSFETCNPDQGHLQTQETNNLPSLPSNCLDLGCAWVESTIPMFGRRETTSPYRHARIHPFRRETTPIHFNNDGRTRHLPCRLGNALHEWTMCAGVSLPKGDLLFRSVLSLLPGGGGSITFIHLFQNLIHLFQNLSDKKRIAKQAALGESIPFVSKVFSAGRNIQYSDPYPVENSLHCTERSMGQRKRQTRHTREEML
jgi:hypothetical protein